jgi:hypothetical protein
MSELRYGSLMSELSESEGAPKGLSNILNTLTRSTHSTYSTHSRNPFDSYYLMYLHVKQSFAHQAGGAQ